MDTRARATGLLLGAALALAAAPAYAEAPKAPKAEEDPSLYVDPSYDPAAHAGLPYGTYLRMTRGTGRRSSGMMATGIVFTGVGAIGMALGTGLYATAHCDSIPGVDIRDDSGGSSSSARCTHGPGHTMGVAILVAGTLFAAVGIPLWVLGGSQVPWVEAAGANERARPSTWARLVPEVAPAAVGRGVDLTWRF